MKNWNAKCWLALLALPLSLAVAASADTPPEGPPAVGTLTVQWTISGRRDPINCGSLGIDRIELSVRSSVEDEEGGDAPCDAFQLSIDLPPGTYAGDAVLVDRLDRPVTLALPLEQMEIVAGRELIESIDFPVGAFL